MTWHPARFAVALVLAGLPTIRTGVAFGQPSGTAPVRTPHQRVEPSLSQAIEEGASVGRGTKLYVIGGLDTAGNDSAAVYVYDGRKWANGPRLPLALDHLAASVLGNDIYVAGGFGASGTSDRVFVLSTAARSWQPAGRLKQARGALALVALHGSLYALGGKNSLGIERTSVEMYRPGASQWRLLHTQFPSPRDHLTGFTYRSSVCVAGGRPPTTARVDCFNPQRRAWWRLPDLPFATSGAGGTTFRGHPMIGGGELATEGGGIIPQLAVLTAGRWRVFHMLVPRHGIQFSQFRYRIWVCGGGIQPGLHPVRTCTSIS